MNDEVGYCANPACCLLPMLCAVTRNPPYVDMSGVVSRLKVKLYEVEKKTPFEILRLFYWHKFYVNSAVAFSKRGFLLGLRKHVPISLSSSRVLDRTF